MIDLGSSCWGSSFVDSSWSRFVEVEVGYFDLWGSRFEVDSWGSRFEFDSSFVRLIKKVAKEWTLDWRIVKLILKI